ncbi:MAG: peptide deformylase [Actinomycetota bacterium]|nr:peptide deformylase [Actinomycetota bacterium]
MSILQMRIFGDPILTTKAQTVTTFDADLARLTDDMFDTMYAAPGVGLAAPQVGVSKRLFTFDDGETSGVLANADITWHSEEKQLGEEGCLSLPGLYLPVERSMQVRVTAQTLDGEEAHLEGEGLLARIFQHEIDHTNGILFIDRLTPEYRREAMKALREVELGLRAAPAPKPTQAL